MKLNSVILCIPGVLYGLTHSLDILNSHCESLSHSIGSLILPRFMDEHEERVAWEHMRGVSNGSVL